MLNSYSRNGQNLLKFRPIGEISPNLVTLQGSTVQVVPTHVILDYNTKSRFNIAAEITVTRCLSKKQPNFLQKLPKKFIHQFNVKSAVLHKCPKMLLNIQATFARNFDPKIFQKSPNLVTLDVINQHAYMPRLIVLFLDKTCFVKLKCLYHQHS